MAQENVMKFEQLLQSDDALRAKLAQAVASYEGDKSDDYAGIGWFAGGSDEDTDS